MVAALAVLAALSPSAALARDYAYSELPDAGLPADAAPSAAPASIAASETVEDVFRGQGYSHASQDYHQLQLFAHAEDARGGFGGPQATSALPACVSQVHDGRGGDGEGHRFGSRMVHLQAPKSGAAGKSAYGQTRVQRLRLERVELGAEGTATLVTGDVWVDVATGGMRSIGRLRMPLARVATAPGDVQVFAALDRPRHAVQVVAITAARDPRVPVSAHAVITHGNTTGSSDCGISRTVLQASPSVGDVATLELDVVIGTSEFAPEQPLRVRPPLLFPVFPGAASTASPSAAPTIVNKREVRFRKLRVHLSLTQLSGDAQPIFSASVGWRGREQRTTSFF
ncbi:MAG: hypothetical protein EXR75_16315 [Myxococcales bacterium]|nr:hypothetical protein [Myxococcales bacterium]